MKIKNDIGFWNFSESDLENNIEMECSNCNKWGILSDWQEKQIETTSGKQGTLGCPNCNTLLDFKNGSNNLSRLIDPNLKKKTLEESTNKYNFNYIENLEINDGFSGKTRNTQKYFCISGDFLEFSSLESTYLDIDETKEMGMLADIYDNWRKQK